MICLSSSSCWQHGWSRMEVHNLNQSGLHGLGKKHSRSVSQPQPLSRRSLKYPLVEKFSFKLEITKVSLNRIYTIQNIVWKTVHLEKQYRLYYIVQLEISNTVGKAKCRFNFNIENIECTQSMLVEIKWKFAKPFQLLDISNSLFKVHVSQIQVQVW